MDDDEPPTDRRGPGHHALYAVRSHPVLTAVLVAGALAATGLSLYIGLDLFFAIPILAIVAGIATALYRLWRSRQPVGSEVSASTGGRIGFAAVLLAGVLTFVLIQFVPYGRAHSNPPGSGEPAWATPRTCELVVDACYSCHSNEVEYPAYASVAPISWAVERHVEEGRAKVNYSDFATDPGEADESVEVLEDGEMPPGYFTRFGRHPEADLSQAEMEELIAGLRATPGLGDGD